MLTRTISSLGRRALPSLRAGKPLISLSFSRFPASTPIVAARFLSLSSRRPNHHASTGSILSRLPTPSPSRPSPTLLRLRLRLPRPSQHRTYYHDPSDPRIRNARPLFQTTTLRRVGRSPRTWTIATLAFLAAIAFYLANLETVPVSGRRRFNCYSRERMRELAESQYKLLMYELERSGASILPDWDPRTVMVKRVMRRLIPFSGLVDEAWEVFVVEDPGNANAFVLPGGKVFVFSGILPVAGGDAGLAAVLGHEIAHVVADHAAEQMSQSIGTNILLYSGLLLGAGSVLMWLLGPWFMSAAFGNPMSRMQESEADFVGLMMMAEACYDPREALGFWLRMEQRKAVQPPEWLSTHPSDINRAKKIQEWLPKAMEKRADSDCASTTSFAEMFKRALDRGVLLGDGW